MFQWGFGDGGHGVFVFVIYKPISNGLTMRQFRCFVLSLDSLDSLDFFFLFDALNIPNLYALFMKIVNRSAISFVAIESDIWEQILTEVKHLFK